MLRHRHRTILDLVDGSEVELSGGRDINEDSIIQFTVGEVDKDHYCVVGYLEPDSDCRDIDDLLGDCMGELYSSSRHAASREHEKMQEALGLDSDWQHDLDAVWNNHPEYAIEKYISRILITHEEKYLRAEIEEYCPEMEERFKGGEPFEKIVAAFLHEDCDQVYLWANVMFDEDMSAVLEEMFFEDRFFPGDPDVVILDCYDHGGQVWSTTGNGMQCQWDTAAGAGVWVPDDCLRKQLDTDEASGLDRKEQRMKYCQQFLEQYNSIINGDVWIAVVEVFHAEEGSVCDTTSVNTDSCGGLIGHKYACESLREMAEGAVIEYAKALKEELTEWKQQQQNLPLEG